MPEPLSTPAPDGLPVPRRYLAISVLLLTLVLVVLDGAIANVALPSIAASFGADPSSTVWVVSSYQIAVLIALLPCGALGEIYGPRRVYLIGIFIFTAASVVCAFAPNLPALVMGRFAQGLGGGALMALSSMNLRFAVPHRRLGTIIGINAMTVAISAAAGPAVAGAILSVATWHWLFAINIPLGLYALISGGALAHTPGVKRPLHPAVLIANTAMFILFFSGADRVATDPATGALMIAGSVVGLVTSLRLERNNPTPLIPTDLLAAPAFRVALTASTTCFVAQMLSYIALPFYLHYELSMPPAQIGLYMMPWPVATTIVAPIAGRLAERVRTAWLCAFGGMLLSIGVLIAGLSPPDPKGTAFLIGAVIAGSGFGLFQTPNNRTLLLSAPKARAGAAGATQGTARLLGQSLGAIVMAIIFQTVPVERAPTIALVIAGALAATSAMISFARVRLEKVE